VFTALLDTCVLWPSLQRDFLLSLAVEGMYRPTWSSAILDELEHEERVKWIRRGETDSEAAGRARRLIKQMRHSFDDAEVKGWEGLEGTYDLPDPNDEHLVAAAVVANAGAIVTHNTKDLPRNRMPAGLQVLTPQEFTMNTVSLDPVRAWAAIASLVRRSGRIGPSLTEADVLARLADRYKMTAAVEILRRYLGNSRSPDAPVPEG
jgi:predicted nucleic acid-binding protein